MVKNLTWIHENTRAEGIASIPVWARTYCDMILNFTLCVDSAFAAAWIDAISVLASLIGAALDVIRTFTTTAVAERISTVTWWARTDWSSTEGFLTHRVCAARAS